MIHAIYAMLSLAVIMVLFVVLMYLSNSKLKQEIARMDALIAKMRKVLIEVEQRSCVYNPPEPLGYHGTAGGGQPALGETLISDWYVPIKTYVTAMFDYLGLRTERTPAVKSRVIIKQGTVKKI